MSFLTNEVHQLCSFLGIKCNNYLSYETLVQKTLFKWGKNDFLNRFMIRLIGGRFKKLSLILSLYPLPDLKSYNLNRFTPSKIL